MGSHQKGHSPRQQKSAISTPPQGSSPATKSHDTPLSRARRHIAAGNYQKALDLLRSAGSDSHVRNAIGVCCLRMGRIDDAVPVFRSLVLAPGCVWVRDNVPIVHRTNYATSLLLGGHPSGCEEMLAGLTDNDHPSVGRLNQAIQAWVGSLTWWQRLNWRIGRIEPKECRVQLDFAPGDLEEDFAGHEQEQPHGPDETGRTAA